MTHTEGIRIQESVDRNDSLAIPDISDSFFKEKTREHFAECLCGGDD